MTQHFDGYYPQHSDSCNLEACKRCRNQFTCSKYQQYLSSLNNIPMSPTPSCMTQTNQSNINSENVQTQSEQFQKSLVDIDFTSIIQSNQDLKQSMVDVILNKFVILENKYSELKEVNENLTSKISDVLENFAKLDYFIKMIESYNTQNDVSEDSETISNGLTVYTGETEQQKILVEKKKKGIFGIGAKTEWVEENKK